MDGLQPIQRHLHAQAVELQFAQNDFARMEQPLRQKSVRSDADRPTIVDLVEYPANVHHVIPQGGLTTRQHQVDGMSEAAGDPGDFFQRELLNLTAELLPVEAMCTAGIAPVCDEVCE